MSELEVHATLTNTSGLPRGVANHGIVTPEQYSDLLAKSKVRIHGHRVKESQTTRRQTKLNRRTTKTFTTPGLGSAWLLKRSAKSLCARATAELSCESGFPAQMEERPSRFVPCQSDITLLKLDFVVAGAGRSWVPAGEHGSAGGPGTRLRLPQPQVHRQRNPHPANSQQTHEQKGALLKAIASSKIQPTILREETLANNEQTANTQELHCLTG